MKSRPALVLSLALALQAILPSALRAAYNFTITDLGTLGGTYSDPAAVNDSGQVVGKAMLPSGSYRAFAWWKGTMIDLGTLGGDYSAATGINDQGLIVGESYTAAHKTHAFVYSFTNGVMSDLGTLGGDYSTAAAVNNNGLIVGTASLASGDNRAFVFANGAMTDLGTLGGQFSSASAIDDNNVIVGTSATSQASPFGYNDHGFAFINGQMLDLSIFGGDLDSTDVPIYPAGVSDAGVAGSADPDLLDGFGPEGFICYPGQSVIYIGNGKDIVGAANGINAAGQVVGFYASYATNAMLYSNGVFYDLNPLVDPVGTDFTHLTVATAISNNGYIVGYGLTRNEEYHAFLLTPIPAP